MKALNINPQTGLKFGKTPTKYQKAHEVMGDGWEEDYRKEGLKRAEERKIVADAAKKIADEKAAKEAEEKKVMDEIAKEEAHIAEMKAQLEEKKKLADPVINAALDVIQKETK
jgi:hypothetical protein